MKYANPGPGFLSNLIAGKRDRGIYQRPDNTDKMRYSACTQMPGAHLLDGAGHRAQQEQREQVSELLVALLRFRNRA